MIPTENLLRGQPITWGEQVRQYYHANTFAALYLTALSANNNQPTRDFESMRDFAQWTLGEALEVPTDNIDQIRRTEMYVPAAAQWILLAGECIWGFCKERAGNDGSMVDQRWIGGYDGGDLVWKGEEGYGVERWAFWKKRFGEIGNLEGTEAVVRRSAVEADETMRKIEAE